MDKDLSGYGQYKSDLLTKLDFNFEPGRKMLDVGCGDGSDANIFIKEFGLNVFGIDVYEHQNINQIKNLSFQEASIYNIPFSDCTFDYVFLHDVLHHVDEERQSEQKHIMALQELARVLKIGGQIIIIEGNRYNPLFYPHMVLLEGHNHWRQSYFLKVVKRIFGNEQYSIKSKFVESHVYPAKFIRFWKLYEFLMEKFIPKVFLAYNIVIVKKIE